MTPPRPRPESPAEPVEILSELRSVGQDGGRLLQIDGPQLAELPPDVRPATGRLGLDPVDEEQPSPRSNAVRHIEKLFREEFGKIVEHIPLQQLSVECCHTVDCMAPHTGKICHPDGFCAGFIDQRKPRDPPVIGLVFCPYILQEPPVNFENDFKMPRQKA